MKLKNIQLTLEESRNVDTIRGFFCLYIFCFHFYSSKLFAGTIFEDISKLLLGKGYIVVQLFFVISGFLISHSFTKIQLNFLEKEVWKVFYIKRIFRIFPAWFTVLVIATFFKEDISIQQFLWNFFLLFGLQPYKLSDLIVIQSWSLYVEEVFYLFFPAIIYFIKTQRIIFITILFFLSSIAFNQLYKIPSDHSFFTPFNTYLYFGLGISGYYFLEKLRKFKSTFEPTWIYFVVLLVLTLLSIDKEKLLYGYSIFWILFIVSDTTYLTKALHLLFNRFGKLCYAVYLVHTVCISRTSWIYNKFFPNLDLTPSTSCLIKFLISLFLTLLSAFLLYWIVERPFVLLSKRLCHRYSLDHSP